MGRRALLLSLYVAVLGLSRWLAYQFRFEFAVPERFRSDWLFNSTWILGIKILALYGFGQFSGLLGYFSLPDLRRLTYAVTCSSLVLLGCRYWLGATRVGPAGVICVDFVFSLAGLVAVRLGFRLFKERASALPVNGVARRVGIIGAGDAGAILVRELSSKRALGLRPVAFFDDDRTKWRSRVHQIPVVGPPEALVRCGRDLGIKEVIIAMPSAPAKRIKEIIQFLSRAGLQFQTVPSLEQLATGQVKVSNIRTIEIDDLLGREPVQLRMEDIRHSLEGRHVLVTGAGGSIGSELCRQIASYGPKRLILVERSEGNLFQVEQELRDLGYGPLLAPMVADILDRERISSVFSRFRPEVVFHAAAHKHVPMMESQPGEAFRNNTLGTVQVAELAMRHQADRFLLISTDKAINPTNVMGTTKRLAERFLQALSAEGAGRTKFMAVRFGNVLGSSGSVIPIFKKQIARGGPVRVTHPRVTRYFMTIPEAVGLVLQSAAQGSGGEIFVLDMGQPVRIADLARQMIELSGLMPGEDIDIEYTGLRPGEKLFEELSYASENMTATAHPKIHRFLSQPESMQSVRERLEVLTRHLHDPDPNTMKRLLEIAVPEYTPCFCE
jgi:FlaA1/EpsC-like NDP-sugar epimerase